MAKQGKGFLNQNRYKSSKAIKQQAKRRTGERWSKEISRVAPGHGK